MLYFLPIGHTLSISAIMHYHNQPPCPHLFHTLILLLPFNSFPSSSSNISDCFTYYAWSLSDVYKIMFKQATPCLLISTLASLLAFASCLAHLLHLLALHSAPSCSSPLSSPAANGHLAHLAPGLAAPNSCLCLAKTPLWHAGRLLYTGLACSQVLNHTMVP